MNISPRNINSSPRLREIVEIGLATSEIFENHKIPDLCRMLSRNPCRFRLSIVWTKYLNNCEAEYCKRPGTHRAALPCKTNKKAVTLHHFTETFWQSVERNGGQIASRHHTFCVASSQQARADTEPWGGNRPGPVQVGCTSDRPVIHWMTFTWGLKTVETTGRATSWLGKSIDRVVCVCMCLLG